MARPACSISASTRRRSTASVRTSPGLRNEDLRDLFRKERLAEDIGPVFTTRFTRKAIRLALADTTIELALDRGEIRSGERSLPTCEAELELVSGRPSRIYELALVLQDSVPFRIEPRTKAGRGYQLALDRGAEPVRAARPPLDPSMSVAQEFSAVARSCRDQVTANEPAVLEAVDPEGVHQMRVGLRRLRAALQAFRPHLVAEAYAFLKAELGWLHKTLGPARDWDVFLSQTLPPIEMRLAGESSLEALCGAAQAARQAAYERAQAAIADPRYAHFFLRLNLALEEGTLVDHAAGPHDGAEAEPVAACAKGVLAKRDAKLRRGGRGHATLDEAGLHRLRIEAKKLRYATEFFRSLHRGRRAKSYLKAVTGIQETLGALNDCAATRRLLEELHPRTTPARSPGKGPTERAVGIVAGWQAGRAEHGLGNFAEAWKAYSKAKPFWP